MNKRGAKKGEGGKRCKGVEPGTGAGVESRNALGTRGAAEVADGPTPCGESLGRYMSRNPIEPNQN